MKKIKTLKSSENVHTIVKRRSGGNASASDSYSVDDSPLGYLTNSVGKTGTGKGTGSTIYWDVTSTKGGKNVNGKRKRPKFIGLLHEVFHSYQMDKGEMRRNKTSGAKQSEREAVHFENQMRAQLGKVFFIKKIPLRKWYDNIDVLRQDFDYKNNRIFPKIIIPPSVPRWEMPKGI